MSGRCVVDGLHGRRAVFALGHDLQLGPGCGQHAAQFGARQVFVVGDDGGEGGAMVMARSSSGTVMVAATPPSGRAFSVSAARSPYNCARRSRMLVRPEAAARGRDAEADAVVGHRQRQPAVVLRLGAHLDAGRADLHLDAMLDGVLGQRDQHQRRAVRRQQLRRRLHAELQPRHARGHQARGRRARSRTAPPTRGLRRAVAAQPRDRGAQVVDQAVDHLAGARRVGGDGAAHAGQRVEQEVRLHLRRQHRQPQLGFAPLRLRLGQRTFLRQRRQAAAFAAPAQQPEAAGQQEATPVPACRGWPSAWTGPPAGRRAARPMPPGSSGCGWSCRWSSRRGGACRRRRRCPVRSAMNCLIGSAPQAVNAATASTVASTEPASAQPSADGAQPRRRTQRPSQRPQPGRQQHRQQHLGRAAPGAVAGRVGHRHAGQQHGGHQRQHQRPPGASVRAARAC